MSRSTPALPHERYKGSLISWDSDVKPHARRQFAQWSEKELRRRFPAWKAYKADNEVCLRCGHRFSFPERGLSPKGFEMAVTSIAGWSPLRREIQRVFERLAEECERRREAEKVAEGKEWEVGTECEDCARREVYMDERTFLRWMENFWREHLSDLDLQIRTMFRSLDTYQRGYLQREDVERAVVHVLRIPEISVEEAERLRGNLLIDRLFSEADENSDGIVTLEEFSKILTTFLHSKTEKSKYSEKNSIFGSSYSRSGGEVENGGEMEIRKTSLMSYYLEQRR